MNRLAVKKQRPGYPRALVFKLRSGVRGTQAMTESNASQSTLPAHDQQAGPLGLVRMANVWSPTDRWAWACSLPVSGIARAVASCIARHANHLTGLAWPGVERIASETGFKRTAVKAGIQELERGGHLTVRRAKAEKKNRANRYQLPAMGGSPHDRGGGRHTTGGGGSPRDP